MRPPTPEPLAAAFEPFRSADPAFESPKEEVEVVPVDGSLDEAPLVDGDREIA